MATNARSRVALHSAWVPEHTVTMREIVVEKLNVKGQQVVSYRGVVIQRPPGEICLEARWAMPARDLGYVRFEPGDRFVEWFYSDHWYNIFEIHSRETDALVGWYCNVATPATIEQGIVRYRDLLLDLWVSRDGTMLVLDEDEFAADATMDDLTREAARNALMSLRTLVERRAPPFESISSITESPHPT